jgi:hypothetical protein
MALDDRLDLYAIKTSFERATKAAVRYDIPGALILAGLILLAVEPNNTGAEARRREEDAVSARG